MASQVFPDPRHRKESVSLLGLHGQWHPATDEYGRLYWFNVLTNETSWIAPDKIPRYPGIPPPLIDLDEEENRTVPHYTAKGDIVQVKGSRRNSRRRSSVLNSSALLRFSSFQASNPIIGLIDFCGQSWDFDNDEVFTYRCLASKHDISSILPTAKSLEFPQYFSNFPIPRKPHVPVYIRVLDDSEPLKFMVTPTETACSLIRQIISKSGKEVEEGKCVLKVVGREEYLYGEECVWKYEYVRYQIRHDLKISLSFHIHPDMESMLSNRKRLLDKEIGKPVYPFTITNASVPSREQRESKDSSGSWEDWEYISADKLDLPLRLLILGIDNVKEFPRFDHSMTSFSVRFELFHGTFPIPNSSFETDGQTSIASDPRFYQWMSLSNLPICKLPWETRISFLVYGTTNESKKVLFGYVTPQLFDHRNFMIAGNRALKLWCLPEGKSDLDDLHFITRGTTKMNRSNPNCPTLNVRFDDFCLPVHRNPQFKLKKRLAPSKLTAFTEIDVKDREKIEKILAKDLLEPLSDEEKGLLWKGRRLYMDKPLLLPTMLRSVNWIDPVMAEQARVLTLEWSRFERPESALLLLDAHFPDAFIRLHAISYLRQMEDCLLREYILQLVQVLKYEPHDYSLLSEFLIERAVANPYQIGHVLFWQIKAELHNLDHCERFSLILEEYLLKNPKHAEELLQQNIVINRLLGIADHIVYMRRKKNDDITCTADLHSKIEQLNEEFPRNLQLPLNPRWQTSRIIAEKCKYMSSKKVPLWLEFENVDPFGDSFLVIFKSGDDLRQDQLTLQLINVMDRMWLSEGLDMRMKPYSCVATGVNPENEGVGMLEVVVNSTTISKIQTDFGSTFGALKLGPLVDWIKTHNPGTMFDGAVQNFIRSCAGYCVATSVLGIGDRHNSNIMLTQSGHLFHIDFGHFLGNFKSKLGFKRERSPFVFTPEMAHVMGGLQSDQYKIFEQLCVDSFFLLRSNSALLMSLFLVMQSAGMPELTCEDDLIYLKDRLELETDDEDSAKNLKREIRRSYNDFYRRVDNAIHNLKHQ